MSANMAIKFSSIFIFHFFPPIFFCPSSYLILDSTVQVFKVMTTLFLCFFGGGEGDREFTWKGFHSGTTPWGHFRGAGGVEGRGGQGQGPPQGRGRAVPHSALSRFFVCIVHRGSDGCHILKIFTYYASMFYPWKFRTSFPFNSTSFNPNTFLYSPPTKFVFFTLKQSDCPTDLLHPPVCVGHRGLVRDQIFRNFTYYNITSHNTSIFDP